LDEKEAIPIFDVVANSPAIVITLFETVVSIPSPAVNVIVSPRLTLSAEPNSPAKVIYGLVIFALVIPPSLTYNASETISIVESSTLTSNVVFATVYVKPSPPIKLFATPCEDVST